MTIDDRGMDGSESIPFERRRSASVSSIGGARRASTLDAFQGLGPLKSPKPRTRILAFGVSTTARKRRDG